MRTGQVPDITSREFSIAAPQDSAVAWSPPAVDGSRYVAMQGIKQHTPQQHEIVLLDLTSGASAQLYACDLEWLAWIAQRDVTNSSEAPRLLLCVRSGVFPDGGLRCSLLLYEWQAGCQPDIIWRRPHGRFGYPEGGRSQADIHLSPGHDAIIWQGPTLSPQSANQLEVICLSDRQPGQSQRAMWSADGSYADAPPKQMVIGWSPCGRLVAAVATFPADSTSLDAQGGGNQVEMRGILQVWNAHNGHQVLSLDICEDIFGMSSPLEVANLSVCWAPVEPARLALVNVFWVPPDPGPEGSSSWQPVGAIITMDVPGGDAASVEPWLPWKKQELALHLQFNLTGRPSLLWSPTGNFLWIDTTRIGYVLACQQGQEVWNYATHRHAPGTTIFQWCASRDTYLCSGSPEFCDQHFWGQLQEWHPRLDQLNNQLGLMRCNARWMSPCGCVIVELAACNDTGDIMILTHRDGNASYEIATPWAGYAGMDLSFLDERHTCLDWLPAQQHLLIYALSVLRFVVLVDARKHTVITSVVQPEAPPLQKLSRCFPQNAEHIIHLRWSPDGRALFVQAAATAVSGPCLCKVIDFGKHLAV